MLQSARAKKCAHPATPVRMESKLRVILGGIRCEPGSHACSGNRPSSGPLPAPAPSLPPAPFRNLGKIAHDVHDLPSIAL
eukprot:1805130-Rhodomonas_salina.3